jgi:penicillin amidase
VTLARRLGLLIAVSLVPLLLLILAFIAYIFAGVPAGSADPPAPVKLAGLNAPVSIARDARGIPHVRAQNEHDLFFADGYLQGEERLFQLDVYRRLVAGRLSEVFGSPALDNDIAARTYDVAGLIHDQEVRLAPAEREHLQAFADGVNAAIRTRPLPPEFRALAYSPEPWTVDDSLLASFSTVLALTDSWDDVLVRADVADALGQAGLDAFVPVTDPFYDSPTAGAGHAATAALPPLRVVYPAPSPVALREDERAGLGSNEVVAGAALTATHRALLANDPHLALHMPGIWYLADLAAPGFHVAGATLPGSPGIILGHDERVAWGATNGTVASVEIYRERFRAEDSDEYLAGNRWLQAEHRTETFRVRFGANVKHEYLRTRHGFIFASRGTVRYAAAWRADLERRSPLGAFDALDRATSVADALHALATYPGPTQNFVLADASGTAAYAMAGEIPLDDAWALRAHDGPASGAPVSNVVPFAQLPHVAPSRSTLAFTANDRVYGAGYPYRLTAYFEPPYRAARIAEHLRAKPYDVASFSRIQADVLSLPERDLARAVVAAAQRKHENDPQLQSALAELRAFDGTFVADSSGATDAWALRIAAGSRLVRMHMAPDLAGRYLASHGGLLVTVVLRMLRERPHGWVPNDDFDAFLIDALRDTVADLKAAKAQDEKWGDAGRRVALHPLSSFGWNGWNGVGFPGRGSSYSPHVQAAVVTQSFRAVWDVGNWEAGGIVIPQGESGEPGSPHYTDGAPLWLSGTLAPFPFDAAAVTRATVSSFELRPL